MNPPDFADIQAAAKRLAGVALRTPLFNTFLIDAQLGGRLFIKAEPLQHTGSFKFRGAYNRLAQLSPQERAAGVVAFSSGNHAQAVALAGRMLGVRTTIVMPADAPAVKLNNTRAYGAELVLYDRFGADREAIARELAAERGAVVVPSFDDPHIIAGQGTAGLEIAEQAAEAGCVLDEMIVCASGGGLTAGIALALAETSPSTKIYTAEPAGFNDHQRSFEAGERQANPPRPAAPSLCDALLAAEPGRLTWPITSRLVAGGVSVSDDDVMAAMAFAFKHLRLVVEPGGAAALAAVLSGKRPIAGRTIGVIASGGNVDAPVFAQALAKFGAV